MTTNGTQYTTVITSITRLVHYTKVLCSCWNESLSAKALDYNWKEQRETNGLEASNEHRIVSYKIMQIFTLRAKLSGAMYRSCLCVCNGWRAFVGVCFWVCYHGNSKLCASIFTKLDLWVKVVTISSWLNFGHPVPLGKGFAAGRKFLAPPYYSQLTVFASLRALFSSILKTTQCNNTVQNLQE